jgi:mRNA-degrading endonuclease RelE of RelBE toxin-antitoxin system
MYGYGLEGYGYEGEGFRYPPIQGYYDEPITIATITKEGPRKGMQIKRYPPKVDERWKAAYLLNKKVAKENMWRQFATKALQGVSKEYLKHLLARDPEAYKKALQNKQIREAKKANYRLFFVLKKDKNCIKH